MPKSITIPNQITLARLVLAILFFVLLSFVSIEKVLAGESSRLLLQICLVVFIVAALTDVLDGYLARKWQQVTSFGRIVDPFCDKILILGAFLMFVGKTFFIKTETGAVVNVTGVEPWMAIVILARELLVTTLRAHSEGQGKDFSANWAGKVKMLAQSITIGFVIGTLALDLTFLETFTKVLVWATVVITALSMIPYIQAAREFLFSDEAMGGKPAPTPTDEETK